MTFGLGAGFPAVDGVDAWIDSGRVPGAQHQLMIALSPQSYRRHGGRDFWLEFSGTQGERLGWVRFTFMVSIRNQAVFAATELRPASAPAPDRASVWLGVSEPRRGAREDGR